jgi:cytochrome c biogenesis protein CcmG, thiol:disulfide interchange protein DsbE
MPTKTAGTEAPRLHLANADGKQFSVDDALKTQPLVVLAFFKVSCPVCQMAFPFLERMHKFYPGLPVWGVSQDDASDTTAFANEYGVTFPMLLDESLEWTVKYGLVSVPSVFAVSRDGRIVQAIFGFAKADLEQLNESLAQAAGVPAQTLFTDEDDVPTLRPG